MNSRQEILNLISNYCFLIDTGDLDGFSDLFKHGEWGPEASPPSVGKEELLAALEDVIIYEDGTPRTKHVTANIDLHIDEEAGIAKNQCYITIFQQTDDFPLQAIFIGHYFDEFQRLEAGWCFKKRRIKNVLVGDLSAHAKTAAQLNM